MNAVVNATTQTPWDFDNPWYANTVGVCVAGNYSGWLDIFYCINPGFWGFIGLAIALGFSVIGAGW